MSAPRTAPTEAEVSAVVARHLHREGPLLPILHDLQHEFGFIPETGFQTIAHELNITRAEVYGVVSFYPDFRTEPHGRHVLKICRAEACQSVGARALEEAALARLGLDRPGTTANGAVTVEPVYCLGLCACGPAALLDDKPLAHLDETRLTRLLAEAGA
ncbi:formate dehydrogenase subunit gamma [Roseibium aestuarii]|uniref:Formate dehydrogenase subunit gamma n=1 Tax=Roseibium aestuarii TaxID=2600299 RepID=A0ABW4JWV5_9HYPH|nr:formate dehydrogenase subunit gamma [Roseibium aestuarii]